MKPNTPEQKAERLREVVEQIKPLGWAQVNNWLFEHHGRRYDLSAADINKLDMISMHGHFLVD